MKNLDDEEGTISSQETSEPAASINNRELEKNAPSVPSTETESAV